jgi:hypothetical protein
MLTGGAISVYRFKQRSAIEAKIGHMKNGGHLGHCYLKSPESIIAAIYE